ncbi:LuxR family transcriptional regulator (plasmid) [Sphingomonas paeninsulae]|uniref:LuxR family transcriptional regulator n=1 Tax=Sphingomonas paeninsulae TaxID=2319844 RepID=A0A494TCN4_SPHPE|nr:LuxR family transcriptional regulator [Sphingomonas paeninsulae]AYJ84853.1 LuxR family transcriptional regulator [Sphingomonas paeninsulae]
MSRLAIADAFSQLTRAATTSDELYAALLDVSISMGFAFFALIHHADILLVGGKAIRLHNYPADWVEYYDANALGLVDPVHRASHMTNEGFVWSNIAGLMPLTANDNRMFELGAAKGLGNGYTVPNNIPGEPMGSCTFANGVGVAMPVDMLPVAQLVGLAAFQCARRLWEIRPISTGKPRLTGRQREIVVWGGRGKSDWDTSRILDLKEDTVARHFKDARKKYGVGKRILVIIHALRDGTLSFLDFEPY